jgi:hypothetical protein
MFKLLTITDEKITLSPAMSESAAVLLGEKWEEENDSPMWQLVAADIEIVQE